MSTVTVETSRFGTLEIEAGAIIEFPAGLIGLGGRRWAVVTNDPESAFQWLHSLDDAPLVSSASARRRAVGAPGAHPVAFLLQLRGGAVGRQQRALPRR